MEKVRSFVAIELPWEMKAALTRLQEELKSGSQASVKWVDPSAIHLTLKFLGNVGTDRIGEVTGALEESVRGVTPFHLEAKGLGVFPNLRRTQVVWVGITGDLDGLNRLQQRIESGLANLGFFRENRCFTPHLTIARVRDHVPPSERQELGQLVTATRFENECNIKVDSVRLMRSQLTREGAVYSELALVKLTA